MIGVFIGIMTFVFVFGLIAKAIEQWKYKNKNSKMVKLFDKVADIFCGILFFGAVFIMFASIFMWIYSNLPF